MRGRDLLRAADVVVYDRLVNPALLDEAPPGARLVFAGKRSGEACLAQARINRLLVEHARGGRHVVRLKGGDPFVFGRGGEEAQCLAAAGIPFEVVPGVTSPVAVPAYAGIPLTHRECSSSFAVVAGPAADGSGRAVDWSRLATAVDTLVILMGLERLPSIAAELVAHGRSPGTRVALIRWGTTDAQTVVEGTLGDIAARAERARLAPPVVAVIGDVVALRSRLDWLGGQIAAAGAAPSAGGEPTAGVPARESRSEPRLARPVRASLRE